MDFWARLKGEIKAKNTSQEWIAGKVGVPFGTFRKWMTRKTYPNVKTGVEMAQILDTSVEYLVTGMEGDALTEDERRLLRAYRKLGAHDRHNTLLAVLAWAGKNGPDPEDGGPGGKTEPAG
ncbi:MAG: helix-turn-helix domain-containing protein [Treponema sp.]|nr:helix-turn-helix domain-containing protein [Treponema sp.]